MKKSELKARLADAERALAVARRALAERDRTLAVVLAERDRTLTVVLPEVSTDDGYGLASAGGAWDFGSCLAVLTAYRNHLAASLPVWQRVEPGTVVRKGTRYRLEYMDGDAVERTADADWTVRTSTGPVVYVDPRTVPANPDADLLKVIDEAIPESGRWHAAATAILAAIREAHVIEPKPKQSDDA